ncbi:MAG: Rho termination factor N-terminal domain-containing protein [Microcoleus sp.]
MERSPDENRIIEYLQIRPIGHSQIYTSQIAIPESQQSPIPYQRREILRRSLIEQGSNLIPLIVRRTEAYSNEEEYEVVCGADCCTIARELGIEQLWAWVFEMTDGEVAVARSFMENLAPPPAVKIAQIDTILQQIERSFQEKLDSLTAQIERSVKKNEDLLKKQAKALAERNLETDRIEQITSSIERLEKTFNEKVDKLAKKIEQSNVDRPTASSANSELDLESLLQQLDKTEQLMSIELERTVRSINQYVTEAIADTENYLKNQISTIRSQILTAATQSEIMPKVQPKKSKSQPKKQSKSQSQPQPQPTAESGAADYENLSLRRLKAIGKERKIRGYARMKKPEILAALRQADGK